MLGRNSTLRRIYYKSACEKYGIAKLGITRPTMIHYNLNYDNLFKHEVKNKEGVVLNTKYGDVFSISTGKFTGRSPNDKWIVQNLGSESSKNLWWGDVNKPIMPDVFDDLYETAIKHFNTLSECYVFDGFCGANKKTQKKVRFIHELAWQQHFVKNMFIDDITLGNSNEPDFTIINACSAVNEKWKEHNLNSEVAIAFNIERKIGIILGTWYGGENKKGIFSLMNYWLPMEGIMAMHCSANVGKKGDTALFFGLSGTGKTTISADPNRNLIGDDEHGWDDDGIFNFEGGCYAKTINLKEENEPEIYRAIKKNALLENVFVDADNKPDYDDISITQNGRVSYPINHIDNWHEPQTADHPKNIIFLTCDAFGILPPVAKLGPNEAMYHFLSGYTAKVAGTERGITEPEATFSACFGAAFLTLHPIKYAELLKEKIVKHNCNTYLVNTGWTGGPYGEGKRISIQDTRKCVDAILNGTINDVQFRRDSLFNIDVPMGLPGVDTDIFVPKFTWNDKEKYDQKANELAEMFKNNFKKYSNYKGVDYSEFGPK